MTCIVGIKHNGKVYLGADSLGSNYQNKVVRQDQKVFINGDMVFGFTSSFRMGQIIQYSFNPPIKNKPKQSDMAFMVDEFIPALMDVYRDKHFLKKTNEVASGGVFLVGYNGELYCVESDFQVGISVNGYDACGCGQDFALGSLYTTEPFDFSVEDRIRMAIDSAAQFSPGVGGPIHILSI